MNSQSTKDENKAKLDSPELEIEVDHAEDNVSTLHDFEPLSEEIFDDRTAGFSTVEFCTVYKNKLPKFDHGGKSFKEIYQINAKVNYFNLF